MAMPCSSQGTAAAYSDPRQRCTPRRVTALASSGPGSEAAAEAEDAPSGERPGPVTIEAAAVDLRAKAPVVDVVGNGHNGFAVLCIEDNEASLRLLERVLARRPGTEVIPAPDGTSGVQLAQVRHPGLVLVDLNLPDMSGLDVVRTLTEAPSTRTIPIVVLSAESGRRQRANAIAAGARDYLTKPFEIDDLLAIVDAAREGARAGQAAGNSS